MIHDQAICPFCGQSVEEFENFCPRCGKPLTTFATTDPLQSIRAQGEMIRSSMKRPTTFVLVGMCLLFGLPAIFFVVVIFVFLFDAQSGVIDKLIGLSLCGFFAWLYFAIVRNVIRGYVASRKDQGHGDASTLDEE